MQYSFTILTYIGIIAFGVAILYMILLRYLTKIVLIVSIIAIFCCGVLVGLMTYFNSNLFENDYLTHMIVRMSIIWVVTLGFTGFACY